MGIQYTFNPFTGTFDAIQDLSSFVVGPASSTDNAITRFDGTTGKLVQDSLVLVTDTGKITNLTDGTAASDAVNFGQLSLYIPLTQKGANNGVATLDGAGHIPLSQLPPTLVEYQGTWDASTNTPTLSNASGIYNVSGYFFIVSTAGTVDFGAGPITFNAGDWVLYNGTIWERAVQSNVVQSVNGQTGIVVLNATDVGAANQALSNLSATTLINSDLNPDTNNTRKLGDSTSTQWLSANALRFISNLSPDVMISGVLTGAVTGITGVGIAHTGLSSFPGLTQDPLYVTTTTDSTVNAVATASVIISTGAKGAGTGNSGDLTLLVGASSGGTQGSIKFLKSGVPSVSGQIWTASATDGTGYWANNSATGAITALTGDATATGPGSAALTLATVNGNVGTFGTATQVSTITVNAKGLITAASNTAIQITEAQVTNLVTDLAGKQATGNYITALTGDVTATGPGSVAATLATVNGNVGSFGSLTSIPTFTVNGKGLITAASNNAVPTTPVASTFTGWDANKNIEANSFISDLTTTATAAGTTTLTVSSTQFQQFTGTTTQTVVLPNATTLKVGQSFIITNRSTGTVTVNANGGGLLQAMAGGSQATFTVVTIGTSAGTWDVQYTISGTVVAINPTVQTFTTGTAATYTTPAGVQYIRIRMVGGGSGGSGSGTTQTNSGAGGNTTFGTSLLVANGGGATAGATGGAGGTASLGTGPIGTAMSGATGSNASSSTTSGVNLDGAPPGASYFGGAGRVAATAGGAAVANSGSGGAGGGISGGASQICGGGGGAGGYVEAIINSPSATYTYSVGTAGTAGAAGTAGNAGGAGAAGYIEVTEFYTNLSVGTTSSVAAGTFLAGPISGANANPTFRALQLPTIQKFTTGTAATYTTATGALYIRVRMVGGGGGGGGNGTGSSAGGAGGSSTFGTLTAANGAGGAISLAGGAGGAATIGAGFVGTGLSGGPGGSGTGFTVTLSPDGGNGASSFFSGGGAGGSGTSAGSAAPVNTGSGGGGAGGNGANSFNGSGGGGSGAIIDVITSAAPSTTYTYTVGAAGTAGGAGTGGAAGGAGAAGYIEVTEYYQ